MGVVDRSALGLMLGLASREPSTALLALAVVTGVGWVAAARPWALATALLAGTVVVAVQAASSSLAMERTFFGSYRVEADHQTHTLVHGTTTHGMQFIDPVRRGMPTTYYAEGGPLGDVFDTTTPDQVGVVGLGTGTVAAYGRDGQEMTFFEIDKAIAEMARDTRLFTYLEDSPADIDIRVGDGRLLVADEPEAAYDLLVLDAFSSDSIPIHLLTREAMREFADHVDGEGALAIHISNRMFDLEPVMAGAAESLGWTGVVGTGGEGDGPGAALSQWVVLAPSPGIAEDLDERAGWRRLHTGRQVRWTDDYSSIMSVLR